MENKISEQEVLNVQVDENGKEIETLNSNLIYRQIFENGLNDPNMDTDKEYYSHVNGFTMIDKNTFVFALCSVNDYSNNNTKLVIVKLDENDRTKVTLRELVGPFGHANSLAYNETNSLLYVGACSTYINNTSALQANGDIYMINLSDLSYTKKVLKKEIGAFAIDENGKMYGKSGNIIYFIDNDFNITKSITVKPTTNWKTNQSFTVQKNRIYINNSDPEILTVYDIDGNSLANYNMNMYIDDSYFLGELEDISFFGDDLYFATDVAGCKDSTIRWTNIGRTSLEKKVIMVPFKRDYLSSNYITVHLKSEINPNPTLSGFFNQIQELDDWANSPNSSRFKIRCLIEASNNQYYSLVTSNKIVRLEGVGNSTTRPTIYGLRLIGIDCSITNLNFMNGNNIYTSSFFVLSSSIHMHNCSIYGRNNNVGLEIDNSYALIHPNVECNNTIIICNKSEINTGTIIRDNIFPVDRENRCKLLVGTNLKMNVLGQEYNIPSKIINYYNNFSACLGNFSVLNVVVKQVTGEQIYKFPIQDTKNKTYSIRFFNLLDAPEGTECYNYEMNLNMDVTNNKFKLNVMKCLCICNNGKNTLNPAGINEYSAIHEIYLSND